MPYTKRQNELLEFIIKSRNDTGISPTQKEMAQYFNLSTPTIHQHIDELTRKGAISRVAWEARSIKIIDKEWMAQYASRTEDSQVILDHLFSNYRHDFNGSDTYCCECGLLRASPIHATNE